MLLFGCVPRRKTHHLQERGHVQWFHLDRLVESLHRVILENINTNFVDSIMTQNVPQG